MANASATPARLLLLVVLLLSSRSPAAAQPQGGPDVRQLQTEVATLRGEIAELKAALADVQRALGVSTPAQATRVTPEMIDVLKTQIEEQAQAKVEAASRLPVKLFGTILTNTYVNSSDAV